MSDAFEHSFVAVARELLRVERRLDELEHQMAKAIAGVAEEHRESARNLVHYVALRQEDLRELQLALAELGLSSLGRSESFVRETLLEVSRRAHEALVFRGNEGARSELERLEKERGRSLSWEKAQACLHRHTRALLGPCPEHRHIYVMVTVPSAKEADRAWMVKMLAAGANVLRINCAHEGPEEWLGAIEALREARRETGKECRILMDLAGPKLRTGLVAGAPHVITWKPLRDEIGNPVTPARVIVRRASLPCETGSPPKLLLDDESFAQVRPGDELRFRDARGKKRVLEVRETGNDELVLSATRRAYVKDRVRARVVRADVKVATVTLTVGGGEGPAVDIRAGDELVLTPRDVEGRAPRRTGDGRVVEPGLVSCALPSALDHLQVGHRVLFDDGRVEAVVEKVDARGDFHLRAVRTQKATIKLHAEKGINLPDTVVDVPALTDDDRQALAFVALHADAVSLSFARRPEDLRALHEELDRLGKPDVGVVLKIETRAGFENLPRLLLEGLRRPPLGVMIARGDLAVEVGFERLAELQEEMLWLCEASHVPAIWATQVLDTLARTGVPSRAEVTDAATGVAAECVMLNKGPFIDEAVRVLSDILGRMEQHHYKKRSLFRKLRVSTFAER